jgi:hypothetical protein
LGFNPKTSLLDQAETPLHLSLEAESIVSSAKICNVVADIRNKEALSKVFKLYKPGVSRCRIQACAVDGRKPVAGHSDQY